MTVTESIREKAPEVPAPTPCPVRTLRGLRREGRQHLRRDGTPPRARPRDGRILPSVVQAGRGQLRRRVRGLSGLGA